MSDSSFLFKQFIVRHDRCAMKVGTDGVLLGAWAPVAQARTALDVGTGTGLVALQLAQRNPSLHVTAVEVDSDAATQAAENVVCSPWPDRIKVVCADFRNFQSDGGFDLIVSNPPYFVDALPCPDRQRNTARHAGGLNYDLLFRRSARLLSEGGVVSIVIPSEVERAAEDFRRSARLLSEGGVVSIVIPSEVERAAEEAAWMHGLCPRRRTRVFTKAGKPARRVLLTFSCRLGPVDEDALYIHQPDGSYSDDYRRLTGEFYLKF